MNLPLIGELIKLRYKLLWAKTRSRNGRIALFLVGYLFVVLALVVMAFGGFGAGLVAVRSGKAELLAQTVLSGLFVNAMIGSVVLGFGLTAGFSGAALRRYPLSATERLAAEQIVCLLDPIWILILGLEFGLAFGLYVFGAASLGLGILAVLLLCITNYLAARIVLRTAELLMQRKGGTVALLFLVVLLSVAPSLVAQTLPRDRALAAPVLNALRVSPPFAAGTLMAGSNPSSAKNLGLLIVWSAALFAVLLRLERLRVSSRAAVSSEISWTSPLDRIGAAFGPTNGPLVARWLRYYWRNTRNRFFFLFAVPLTAFMTGMLAKNTGKMGHPRSLFLVALGTFAMVGFMGTGKMALNLFGYDGAGFRRYFLLPVNASATLRAGIYASTLMSGALIPVAALAWLLFSGTAFDARALVMLLGAAVASLFVYHALAVWTTILAPRRGDFNSSFGNDLSLGGNILFMGSIFLPLVSSQLLAHIADPAGILAYWWVAAPAVATAVGAYFVSLRKASEVFPAYRERLLHVMEGKG